jgi:hypothetical protein
MLIFREQYYGILSKKAKEFIKTLKEVVWNLLINTIQMFEKIDFRDQFF